MDTFNDIFDEILQYEAENNIEDYTAPEEEEDIQLTPEELLVVENMGSKLPPLMEGRDITSSMINFATCVTKSYRICYAQFVQYVDNTNQLSPDELGYCTRTNIDHFFQNVISKRVTSMAVNRRYVSALQKYSKFWEERINFTVESLIVKKALDDAKICKLKHHSSTKKHIDAHKHRPTLHHSVDQELAMITEALTNVEPSKYGYLPQGVNLLISWNCSMQGFTRGDEVRSCRLPDLCHESNYGPWRLADEGINTVQQQSSPSGVLSLIQQPFGTKLRSNKAHVIGFFRHKDWRRCATSIIAFSVMARFETFTETQLLTFFALGNNNIPNWYQYFLIDWRDYDSMADTFKKFFEKAGISYSKLTHTRKLGIIRAHQLGADRENIILLSKHTTHKVDTSYLPELPYKAMLACAGFDVFRREEYFIPRSNIQVPVNWIHKVFPKLSTWEQQVNETWGYDNGLAAKNFVNNTLPFFATIILQDGIYFTSMYPNHPYSKILLSKLGDEGYERWAHDMRAAVEEREQIIIKNTEEDRKYEAVLRTTEKAIQKIYNLEQRIDALTNALLRRNDLPIQNEQDNQQAITPINLNAESFRYTLDATPITMEARIPINVTPTPDHTASLPSTPIIPPNVHKTIKLNMEYWMTHQYWKYMDRNKVSLQALGWSGPMQHRYCKRRDIATWVKVVGEKTLRMPLDWTTDIDIFIHVAAIMDEERGDKTVLQALEEFKNESDLSWKKRRRKNK